MVWRGVDAVVAIVTHDIVEYRIISHPGIRGVGAFAESQLLPTTLRALRNPASFPHGMAGSGRFRGIPIVTHDIVDIAESRIIFPLYGGPPAWVMKREWDFFPKVPPGRVELSAAAAAAPRYPGGKWCGIPQVGNNWGQLSPPCHGDSEQAGGKWCGIPRRNVVGNN
jgi:hypothetical protein